MSKVIAGKVGDLLKNELWREACDIAEYMYGILHEFPEEEKWDSERKLRTSANDVMYYTAQAIANGTPTGGEYDWANARKSLSTLLTMYRFAGRQKMIKLDPEMMVRLEKLFAKLDNETDKATKLTKAYNDNDLEFWRAKYELMKKAHGEARK